GNRLSGGPVPGGGLHELHADCHADSDDLQRYGAGAEYELQLPGDGGGCGGQCEYGFSPWYGEHAGGYDAAERADGSDSDGGERDGDQPVVDGLHGRRGGDGLATRGLAGGGGR